VITGARAVLRIIETLLLTAILAAVSISTWALVPGPTAPAPTTSRVAGLRGTLVKIDGSPTVGSTSAPVVVIEFTDYQCPFCRRFAQRTAPQVMSHFIETGKVRWVFKNLPLTAIHPFATRLAAGASCAAKDGKLLEVQEGLWQAQSIRDDRALTALAVGLGLDARRFAVCLDSDGKQRVSADLAQAAELKLSSTPTFLLGVPTSSGDIRVENAVEGAGSFEEFGRHIEALLLLK